MTLAASKAKGMSTTRKVILAIGGSFLVLMTVKSVMHYYESAERKRAACEQGRKVLNQMEQDFLADKDAIQRDHKQIFNSMQLSIREFKDQTEKFCGPVE